MSIRKANNCVFNEDNLIVEGNNNVFNGDNCDAIGHNNVFNGDNCCVRGNNNVINGDNGNATGQNNIINGDNGSLHRNMNIVNATTQFIPERNRFGQYQINRGFIGNVGVGGAVDGWRDPNFFKIKNEHNESKDESFVEGPNPNDIKDDSEATIEADECVLCKANKIVCIVLPCRHLCVCITCAVTLCSGPDKNELKKVGDVTCPMCREKCNSILKVFK